MVTSPRSLPALLLAAALGGLLPAPPARSTSPNWHWEDAFSRREQATLTAWILEAEAGLVALFGTLPYSYDVHFHRLEGRSEPVPWANTSKRNGGRAVEFYVDPAFDARQFAEDWTASHELSHLMFPYLGRSGMWFAEGIASYLQYQVMYANGILSWPQAMDRYRDRFQRAARDRRVAGVPIAELPKLVRQTRSYVRLYWGGAAYFLEADRRLENHHGKRLHDVIRDYLACCFGQGRGAMDMIRLFDRVSATEVFSEVYGETVEAPDFPATDAGLAWLRQHPPRLAGPAAATP